MTTTLDPVDETAAVDDYRALSSSAAVSAGAGLLSLAAFLDWRLALIPVVGLITGLHALLTIRRNPEEFTGTKLAWLGLALSTLCWAGGWGWLSYVYATEVPEGYERIQYALLQPEGAPPPTIDPTDPQPLHEAPIAIPKSAMALNGQRVFLQGYMYPSSQKSRIREFVLVRDNGTCCFGGPLPKLTDMVLVKLEEPLMLDYKTRVTSVAGTFHVENVATEGLGRVLYRLEADYAK